MTDQIIDIKKRLLYDEHIIYELHTNKKNPYKEYRSQIIVGSILFFANLFFTLMWFYPLWKNGQMTTYKGASKKEVVITFDNLSEMFPVILFHGVFGLISFSILAFGLYYICKKGETFLITTNRLIRISNNKIQNYDWGSFTGSTSISNIKNEFGTLELELKNNYNSIDSNKQKRNEIVYLIGITKSAEIELEIRKLMR